MSRLPGTSNRCCGKFDCTYGFRGLGQKIETCSNRRSNVQLSGLFKTAVRIGQVYGTDEIVSLVLWIVASGAESGCGFFSLFNGRLYDRVLRSYGWQRLNPCYCRFYEKGFLVAKKCVSMCDDYVERFRFRLRDLDWNRAVLVHWKLVMQLGGIVYWEVCAFRGGFYILAVRYVLSVFSYSLYA